MTPPSKTNWPLVALAVGAGMAASFQIGKVPPSLPVLREAFALDMVGAGWVASLFSGTAALFGIAAGAIADSVGRRRTLLLALLIMVVGSLGATFATSPATLYASRFAEGLGFLLAVVAGPSVVAETAAPKDMRLALSFWGTYMPVGMALAMIGAPHLIAMGGWN
ncbi:MAG: MFS transporter, partial [Alphaproteobacteria bacterium]|nr:MFS transporter [Alphaproteobacteria bacterium]